MSGTRGMIFLETSHPIIEDTILQKLQPGAKQEPINITCSDFDDVKYQILVTPSEKHILNIHVGMPYFSKLATMGGNAVVGNTYGKWQASSRVQDYDLVFKVDVNDPQGKPEEVAKLFGEIKRNLLAAPFRIAFEALAKGNASAVKPMVIPFRPNEAMVLAPTGDRVNVFFSIYFADETDRAIARVFLQEFSESQRKVPQAPNVSFSVELPGDLAKVPGFRPANDLVGFVMFQMFKTHVADKERMEKIITLFQSLRAYLLYHIKASKAHLHARMRKRVDLLLKVLKRADPHAGEEPTTKKAFRSF